ncbi:hypothetical protein KIPB_011302, partial [Kipferlia bialata]
ALGCMGSTGAMFSLHASPTHGGMRMDTNKIRSDFDRAGEVSISLDSDIERDRERECDSEEPGYRVCEARLDHRPEDLFKRMTKRRNSNLGLTPESVSTMLLDPVTEQREREEEGERQRERERERSRDLMESSAVHAVNRSHDSLLDTKHGPLPGSPLCDRHSPLALGRPRGLAGTRSKSPSLSVGTTRKALQVNTSIPYHERILMEQDLEEIEGERALPEKRDKTPVPFQRVKVPSVFRNTLASPVGPGLGLRSPEGRRSSLQAPVSPMSGSSRSMLASGL